MSPLSQKAIVQDDLHQIVNQLEGDSHCFADATILITGGCGFLGRYLTAAFLEMNRTQLKNSPCRVVVLDTYITSARENTIFDREDPNVTVVEYDVRNPIPTDIAAEYVFHMASLASPFYYSKYPLETIEVNVNGTRNLLEYSKNSRVKKMVSFSSSEIYGDPLAGMIPTSEEYRGYVSCTGPRACYDESKRMGETLCQVYAEKYGVPVITVRPFNVYGPGGLHAQDFRVVPEFMSSIISGKSLPIHGTGTQTRTFCYITDAIVGFVKLLLRGSVGQAYNIGQDKDEITMNDLAQRIQSIHGAHSSLSHIEYPPTYPAGEPLRRCPDLSKARRELLWAPLVDLDEGLSRTYAWYSSFLHD